MSIVVLLFVTALTIIFPILSIPINVLGMLLSSGRIRKCYGLLCAFSLAMIACIWIPDSTMDLYRHHAQLGLLGGYNFHQLGNLIKTNLEPLQYLVKFFVAQSGNQNLLQFLVVFIGYSELFWLICDYCQEKNARRSVFLLASLFAFSAVRFIDFASGLWCNLAIINIALGLYLNYFKKIKWPQYVFYMIAACLHTGTIYVVLLAVLLSKLRIFRRMKVSVFLLLFVILLSFGGIVLLANNLLGAETTIVKMLNSMYDSYFTGGEQFVELHTGWSLVFAIANIISALILSVWYYKKCGRKDSYSSFVAYMSICILATIINSGVFVRYGFLLAILIVPILVDLLSMARNRQIKVVLVTAITTLVLLQLSRSFVQINSAGLTNQIRENIANNTFYLLSE